MKNFSWANVTLILAVLLAGADLGGGFYEHSLIVPVWNAAPPASFALIQPQNGGIELTRFWIPIHSVFNLMLFLTLYFNWREKQKRNLILGALGSYFVMRGWTFAYFIPEISTFMQMPTTATPSAELTARAIRWGTLSHGRTALVALTAILLMVAAIQPSSATRKK